MQENPNTCAFLVLTVLKSAIRIANLDLGLTRLDLRRSIDQILHTQLHFRYDDAIIIRISFCTLLNNQYFISMIFSNLFFCLLFSYLVMQGLRFSEELFTIPKLIWRVIPKAPVATRESFEDCTTPPNGFVTSRILRNYESFLSKSQERSSFLIQALAIHPR